MRRRCEVTVTWTRFDVSGIAVGSSKVRGGRRLLLLLQVVSLRLQQPQQQQPLRHETGHNFTRHVTFFEQQLLM